MGRAHEITYRIHGDAMQLVEVELDADEAVVAEAGMMTFMEEGVEFQTRLGDGSESGVFSKLFRAGMRKLTGESLFMTHFSNQGSAAARVGFSAPFPGQVLPLQLAEHGGEIVCQKDAFLCAAHGTRISVHFNRRLGAGFFGGEGFILQKLEGDGLAFLHACGTVIRRELRGETLRVDTGSLVAFSAGIDFDVKLAGGLKSMMFGGEGIFLTALSGTGSVWLQSLPFSRLADRILASAPSAGGAQKGED
jgi:uncharacterized protein (TIGR00266 family)